MATQVLLDPGLKWIETPCQFHFEIMLPIKSLRSRISLFFVFKNNKKKLDLCIGHKFLNVIA